MYCDWLTKNWFPPGYTNSRHNYRNITQIQTRTTHNHLKVHICRCLCPRRCVAWQLLTASGIAAVWEICVRALKQEMDMAAVKRASCVLKGRIKDGAVTMIMSVWITVAPLSSRWPLTVAGLLKTEEGRERRRAFIAGVVWTVHIERKQARNRVPVRTLGSLLLSNLRCLLPDDLAAACALRLLHSHYREIKSFLHRKWASYPCWCQRLFILCRRCQVLLRPT